MGRRDRREAAIAASNRTFQPAVWREPNTEWGPEPIGAQMAGTLSIEQGLLLSGRGGPRVPAGLTGEGGDAWDGYTVDPQIFQGQAQMGSTTRIVQGGEATAFPSDRVPESLPDPFDPQDW